MALIQLPALLAADVTIIFAYSFSRTLISILVSPEFAARGGWRYEFESLLIAPLAATPEENARLQATIAFATVSASLWVANGVLFNAFTLEANADPPSAATTAALTWLACGVTYVLGGCLAFVLLQQPLSFDADVIAESIGLGVGLGLWRWYFANSMWL